MSFAKCIIFIVYLESEKTLKEEERQTAEQKKKKKRYQSEKKYNIFSTKGRISITSC